MEKIEKALKLLSNYIHNDESKNLAESMALHNGAGEELFNLKQLLKSIEWNGNDANTLCPCCYEKCHKGHKPDCQLAKYLMEGEGNE